jgi:hypothetical protein
MKMRSNSSLARIAASGGRDMTGISGHGLACILAGVFAGIGLAHLGGPRFLRDAYERWSYPQRFRLTVGLLEMIAALLLTSPRLQSWGIALAVFINFGAVVTLLNHRQYVHALPGVILMAACIPAMAAVPRPVHPIYSVSAPSDPNQAGTRFATDGVLAENAGG